MRPPSICDSCDRLRPAEEGEVRTCAAFPKGIPVPIADGSADHRAPWEGDHGKRWILRTDWFAAGDLQVWETYASP